MIGCLAALASIGACAVCVSDLSEKAEDDRIAAAQARDAEDKARKATALAALATLKTKDPPDVWVAKCAHVENTHAEIPDESRGACAAAFASVGQARLKAGDATAALGALQTAKRLGAEHLDEALTAAEKRAQVEAAAAEKRRAAAAKVAADKKEKAEALEREAGPKPTIWANIGGCFECEEALRQVLNDPDSFERMSVTDAQLVTTKRYGPCWRVGMTFRAKNGFGGKMIYSKTFLIKHGGVHIE